MEFQFLEEAESQTAPQQNAGGLQFEYIQGAKEATVEPEPREFFSFEDAVSAIGTIPEALAVGVPAAYQKLVTGLEIPEKSEAIESELAFQQRIQTDQADRVASGKATTFGSAIREAQPSLGFSVLPMVAAIPAGIGGTMVGGPAAPVTGPAAAMAASGTVAYRMAGSDMMYRAYKQLEEAKGSPLTNEEKAEYYKTVLPIAQNYGLWEAGPEAVSNAITIGVGKFVFGFGKQAAKKLVGESIDSANKTIARKVAEKGAAVAGGLGTEIASEGVTSVGQYPEEAKIRQLAATGEVSKGEQPSYPGGYMQAVKDVAPATIALYGMMGTAAGGVKLSTLPFRSQKTPEQIAEDNINLEADRVSRELSIGETDEETKSINAALETARNNLIAKKEVYTALEPNDPAAQSLGLEIREMERDVVALDNELKKRIGQPLSEPITEVNRQQAELAKAIVEEPPPTDKESLTVQPTQAAPVTEAPVTALVEQVVTPPVEVAPTIVEPAPVEPITPAPVTEQAAPAEAPAPEVAPAIEKPKTILYRDTNLDNAVYLLDPDATSPMQELFVAESPEMAIGQKGNTGILIEFDASKINAKPNMKKPGTAVAIQTGSPKEMVATGMDNRDFQQAVTSFSYDPKSIPKNRLQRLSVLEQKLKSAGWSKTELANGKIKVSRQPTPAVSETITEPVLPKLQREKADTDFASIDEITDIIHESSPKGTDKSESKRIATNFVKDSINQTIDWIRDTFGSAPEKVGFDASQMKKWLKDAVSIRPVTEDEFTRGIIKKKGQLTKAGEDRGKIDVSVLSPMESRMIALHEASHFLYHLDEGKQIPEKVLNSIKNKKLMPDKFPNPGKGIKERFADAFTNWAFTKMHPEYANEFPSVPKEFVSWIESETINEPLDYISSVNKIRNQKQGKPKLGEKGGVLIPTKEDFIQAGQNIYEAGMEFGAWAKQMIQRFGDAVREFLGEVWQAVSGAPAKLNELMGYLPKKGEAGAVSVGKGKIGEKAKASEKPTEEAKVEEKPTRNREEIMGEEVGPLKKTPEGIIAKTQELLRKQFDPTEVTEKNTTEAFRALGRLTGKEGTSFAQELNDIGRVVDKSGAASEISMGAALFVNDLFEYAVRLAANGQKMMLGIMMTNINKLPTAAIGASDAARTLRARLELSQRFLTMAQAEQDAYINYVAEFIYGPNPTKEQIQSIKDAYAAVDKTEQVTEQELTDELEDVGNKTGTDLVAKIEDEIAKATPPTKDPIVSAMLTLQKLYGGTIETRYLEVRESAQKIKEGVKKILTGGISNYRGKMVEGAASGLESGFWKTLASEQKRVGTLGELDAAQNRELGNIVKSMLISLGLKGKLGKPLTPDEKKMDIYEQVASILGEKPLSKDKIKLADEKIRGEINRKREKELSETEDQDVQDAINLKYAGIEKAWDQAMAQQLDMPISDAMLRRLIFNELKEEKTSITDLAKLMNEEPVIGSSRQDRLVNSIITKIAGITFEGQNPADYSALKEYLGNQLELLIQEKQLKSNAAKAKAQLAKDAKGSVELQAEKAENEAQSQIERLAKIQSDTPSFPGEAQMNPVREAVKNALKLNLNKMFDPSQSIEIISNFKKSFVKELMGLGVKEAPANILADVVGRQIEINSLNNQLKSIDRAIEKGPISEIVKAIKDTPLEDQQKPNWRYEVMRDYLRRAGLPLAQAERIAKLMDISLQKRFTMAQEQAFTDAISKSAPWKSGDTRSRRAFQKVLQALRAGALDPARNVLSDMAALNGWTGFTPEQYKSMLKYDAILSDPEAGELKKAEAYKAIQDIISKAKLPIRARDVIGQYYDAQALSGIPTLTVNAFSPIAFAMRNAIVEIGSGTLKGNPKAITNAATALIDSIKSWANTVAFSFKNNVTVYSNVDYIVNDDNLLRLYRKGVDQFTKSKNAKERADGVKNMMVGMMDYVRRMLNALDYGAIASLQNQNISKYSMAVMKRQGMSTKEGNEMFAVMMKAKNDFYLQQIAIGTDKNKASILADEFYISSWSDALTKAGVEKSDIKQAMDAAINDALSSVGRNRQSLDSLKHEATKLKDAGVSSMPALWLLESMANAANQSNNQIVKLFSRVIYGFAIVPARVIRETAWFSPYGFVRFGYDAIAKKMGKTSPYAQSLGTDIQYSQRLNEAIAGTVVLIALASLRAGSTDESEEDEFKIVFTGNGPKRNDDPQFYDSWYKAGNKPNTMSVYFGKSKFDLNMMRGFEAFTWPAMMLGALDDLEIRKKQKRDANTGTQLEDASIVAGFVFDAALRRGPYAFTTKSLFGTYGDIGVEGVAKGLTFPAKTLIPVLGTSLASNLSNFINDPVDRRTLDGAVWSNIPFIGPAVAPKSLNAFGEPSLSTDMASKMFKLGVPLVYDIPTDRESIKLHELVLKQGGGPSIPTRNQLAQRLDRDPTNKEYEMFVKEYGMVLTTSMKKNYEKLSAMKPEAYTKVVERIGNRARDIAENKVRVAAKKP